MLTEISEKSAAFLISGHAASERKRNILIYGFQVFYSNLFCTVSILLLGLLQKGLTETLVFLLLFSSLRAMCGGYHAATYGGCFFVTGLAFEIFLLLSRLLLRAPAALSWCLLLACLTGIWFRAPVRNPHRVWTPEQFRRKRKSARKYLFFSAVLLVLYGRIAAISVFSAMTAAAAVVFVMTLIKTR